MRILLLSYQNTPPIKKVDPIEENPFLERSGIIWPEIKKSYLERQKHVLVVEGSYPLTPMALSLLYQMKSTEIVAPSVLVKLKSHYQKKLHRKTKCEFDR